MKSLDAEVFAVGTWNGLEFTVDDLKLIANAFSSLTDYHRVPIKFGHNDEQSMTDGQPALGWVENVWLSGTKLMAKLVDIPDVVYDAIEAKLYRNVSIELDMGVEHKGTYYPWVLSGVALLGADIPAVNVLEDLTSYMGRDGDMSFKKRVFFTKQFSSNREGNSMDDDKIALKEKVHTLELRVDALNGENEKLVQENTDLKNKQIEMKAKFSTVEKAEATRKVAEQRKTTEAKLESMVQEAKIAPFARDDFLRDFDEATTEDARNAVVFAVDKLETTIDGNPAYFGAEQARKAKAKERGEADKKADVIVTERTREYMEKHGEKNFTVAKRAVLRADSELANRYAKMED